MSIGLYSITLPASPFACVIAVSWSSSAFSIVLALKLCRRPSEWPTSCITIFLIACPRNSSGSSSLGWGLFFLGQSLPPPWPVPHLGVRPLSAIAMAATAEVALPARLKLAESPAVGAEFLREFPGEVALVGRDHLGDQPAGVPR